LSLEAKVDDLERRLKRKIESDSGFADEATQAAKLMQVFRHFNTAKDGWITFEEFNAALVRLNFVGVQRETKALFDRFDTDGSGVLSYEEFAAGLYGLIPNVKSDPETRSAVEKFRLKIAERGGKNGIRTLMAILKELDTTGDKRLDRSELKDGMRDFGVNLSDREIDIILNAFDRNHDGYIDFEELLVGIRGNLSARRRALINMAFDVLDKEGTGVVTKAVITSTYDVTHDPDVYNGRKTPDEVITEFMAQWGAEGGVITRDLFLDHYKDVSASIDDEDYFELMIRNAWHISGGEGWYENTANKRVLVVHTDGSEEVVEVKKDLGIKAGDVAEIRKRLVAQGVTDIDRIDLKD